MRPPLAPAAPLLFWAAAAAVLAVLVLAVVPGPGALDDPHEGDQRPGFLQDPDEARSVRGLALPGAPAGRWPVVVIFDRRVPGSEELERFTRNVPKAVDVVLVAADGKPRSFQGRVRGITGDGGRVARAVGMPTPRDGGPPVGYAVIDAAGRVRYATLDPEYSEHGFEVDIVAGALR